MAVQDHRRDLTWPPADGGGLDVFDVEEAARDRAPASAKPSPNARRNDDSLEAPTPQGVQERGGGVTRDEPAHHLRRTRRWRLPGLADVAAVFRARPHRPRWVTTTRVAIVALALLALGEAAFIGLRLARPRPDTPPLPQSISPKGGTGTSIPQAVGTSGRLVVDTAPTGGGVLVDGRSVGTAPVTLPDVTPGQHIVVIESRRGTVRQQVDVSPGQEVNLLVPLASLAPAAPPTARPAPSRGWLSVEAPVEMRVFDGDSLVGTSDMEQIPLSPGKHALVFTNDAIGYRGSQAVAITAGKGSHVALDLPKRTMAINALPWADVWIDGVHVGETPIGRASVTVGRHRVVLRNPDFGERTVDATVTMAQPARISVDMRR